LRADCLRGVDAFLGLEEDWRDLEKRARTGNPFLSWEWISEWCRSFWNEQLVTVSVYVESRPVAIAPFFPGSSLPVPGLRAKHLQLLGPRWGHNLLEMGSVLLDPAHASDALELTVDYLWEQGEWDWIEVLAYGDSIPAWKQALEKSGVRSRTMTESVTEIPVMRLDDTWEHLRSRLRRNVKQSVRHAYNAPRRQGLNYHYREHRSATGLDAVLDDFFRLHRARAAVRDGTPHADHFSRPEAQLFLRRVSKRLAEAGLLSVSVCEADEKCVAVHLNLEMDGTLYLYYSGFDPASAQYGVMTYTTTEAIKSAMHRRLHDVNFSPGVDQAKKRWDVTMTPMARLSIVLDRRRSRARFALYRALRKASGWRRNSRWIGRRPPHAGDEPGGKSPDSPHKRPSSPPKIYSMI
jgi:CelD/BcsL family acetyltransferase involved in cellulose biosynthesis